MFLCGQSAVMIHHEPHRADPEISCKMSSHISGPDANKFSKFSLSSNCGDNADLNLSGNLPGKGSGGRLNAAMLNVLAFLHHGW
jgi:hypothetical protein